MRRLRLFTVAALLLAVTSLAGTPVHVMVVNDDGISAPGIEAMARALAADPAYRVTVVAPMHQQSGVGHALVIRRLIEVAPHDPVAGCTAWAVDATPATTARVGLATILADDPPALVISGINRGENVGTVIWYSGTVGAAREAALLGYPAMAVSLALDWGDPHPDYAAAARWIKPVVDAVREGGLPERTVLNVNVPKDPSKARGYRLVRMSLVVDKDSSYEVIRREGGRRWLSGHWVPGVETSPDADVAALAAGWVTLTPLGIDQTAYRAYPGLEKLMRLEPPAPPAPAAPGP
ncbi:MAG TPA: 5'/3'-nucleotidase SurE [Acidobacteria bacterium]|nr:5'/3'-nucleotidase SurE [Acidobacteriota bacterium]